MRAVAPAGLIPVAWELVSQGVEFGGSVYTVIVPDACLRCLDPAGVLRLRANTSMATGAEDQAAGRVSWYQSRRRRRNHDND